MEVNEGVNGPSRGGSFKLLVGLVLGVAAAAVLGIAGYLVVSDRVVPGPNEALKPAAATTAGPPTTERPDSPDGAPPTKPEQADEPAAPDATLAKGSWGLTDVQNQAATEALDMVRTFPRSRAGLITELVEDPDTSYSVADATVAVDSLDLDWDYHARRRAELAIRSEAISQPGLINHLSSKTLGFTRDQAVDAVEALDVDWTVQPERFAREYIDNTPISRIELLSLMTSAYYLFEEAEAETGIDDAKIDFRKQAALEAEEALEREPNLTCDELIEQLSGKYGDQYTLEEANYGAGTTSAC